MISNDVLSFNDAKAISFHEASVNVDACFLLAYIDSDDFRGDKVAEILDQWSDNEISYIGISNHVVGEVIHNIFKTRIRQILSLTHKKYQATSSRRSFNFKEGDLELIGDLQTAENMRSLVPNDILDNLVRRNELAYSIENLLKEYKSIFPGHTVHLSKYYAESVEKFSDIIKGIKEDLKINIVFPTSDDLVMLEAFSSSSNEQLGIYDAFHMAISRIHKFDYFATLDGDFVSSYLNIGTVSNNTIVIKVA